MSKQQETEDTIFNAVEYGFPTINGDEIVGADAFVSAKGGLICSVTSGPIFGSDAQMHECRRANARRIAACINYCSNISTTELEKRGKK